MFAFTITNRNGKTLAGRSLKSTTQRHAHRFAREAARDLAPRQSLALTYNGEVVETFKTNAKGVVAFTLVSKVEAAAAA